MKLTTILVSNRVNANYDSYSPEALQTMADQITAKGVIDFDGVGVCPITAKVTNKGLEADITINNFKQTN